MTAKAYGHPSYLPSRLPWGSGLETYILFGNFVPITEHWYSEKALNFLIRIYVLIKCEKGMEVDI